MKILALIIAVTFATGCTQSPPHVMPNGVTQFTDGGCDFAIYIVNKDGHDFAVAVSNSGGISIVQITKEAQ